ncbi:MAG: prepilin-type N-terminal cleavage/methylation domain-containing protein [Patescibacteria group bacterium]|jgi:prepilin-type N-terminal cleavage/methylation domain-containing protein
MENSRNQKGVTLIEMMVSISILILLVNIGITVFGQVRIKARDATRISDVQQVEKALAIYYQDHGKYPESAVNDDYGWYGLCAVVSGSSSCSAHQWGLNTEYWVPDLPTDLIVKLPTDPYTDDCTRCYLYRSDGDDYKILANNPEDISNESYLVMIDPSRDGGSDPCSLELNVTPPNTPWSWAVYSTGARCW